MAPLKDLNEFKSLIKYAYAIRLTGPDSPRSVPTICIVFGNHDMPSRCHEYLNRCFEGAKINLRISAGTVTAKVEVSEIENEFRIFSAELNYDENELLDFKGKTPISSRVALIFGFKHGSNYYITGNVGEKSESFSPLVLAAYEILS